MHWILEILVNTLHFKKQPERISPTVTLQQNPGAQNVRNFVRALPRIECFGLPGDGIKIVLPTIFYEATAQMCADTSNETRGLLVCKPCSGDTLLVQSMLVTGKGSAYAVYVDPSKMTAARLMAERHPELVFVEFHTHTTTTGVNGNFSGQDLVSLANAVNAYADYKHVLFTPTHICTFGLKKPRFCVASIPSSGDEELTQRFAEIRDEYVSLW